MSKLVYSVRGASGEWWVFENGLKVGRAETHATAIYIAKRMAEASAAAGEKIELQLFSTVD
jgi:hypothetical protein